MRKERVGQWMSAPPIVVAPTTSLAAAQRLMEQRHVRRLPVVERGRLVGIITWGDLRAAQPSSATTLSVYEMRALLEQVTVAACMSRKPLTIASEAPLLEAAQKMLSWRIGGLPVVDGDRLVGIITESDLFRVLIAEMADESHAEARRETLACYHCGTQMRRRSFAALGPDDECWHCHYHLHRCENCRYFDGIVCMLDRGERHTGVPGQHCPAFSARIQPASVAAPTPAETA
jgi:CBS domain-containing protein